MMTEDPYRTFCGFWSDFSIHLNLFFKKGNQFFKKGNQVVSSAKKVARNLLVQIALEVCLDQQKCVEEA
jgi:hypothetical protein